MSAEQLTCVWQTIYVRGLYKEKGERVFREALKEVTSALSAIPYLQYSENEFMETFQESTVTYEAYKEYVNQNLRPQTVPISLLHDDIENVCWDECKQFYLGPEQSEDNIKKMWMLTNRFIMKNTYPPVMFSGDANWLFAELMRGEQTASFSETVTSSEYLEKVTAQNISADFLSLSVDELYRFLVVEEKLRGKVKSRSRLQANWTAWSSKLCTISFRRVLLHSDPLGTKACKRIGQFFFRKSSRVTDIPDGKGTRGRFRITNGQQEQYEIEVDETSDKTEWIAAIQEGIECLQEDASSVQNLIRKLNEAHQALAETKSSFQVMRTTLFPESLTATNTTEQNGIPEKKESVAKTNKAKMKAVFMQIDKNGNGFVERDEFAIYIRGLGLKMTDQEINIVFDSVDKNGDNSLSYDEFEKYLTKQVLSETSDADAVNSMRVAFMSADRDGSGTIDFKEFSDFMWESKRSGKLLKLQEALLKLQQSGTGQVDFQQFQDMLTKSGALSELSFDPSKSLIDDLEDELKEAYDETDSEELVELINNRWKSFVNFDRKGESGSSVMTSDNKVVKDIVPGQYSLVDLACFTDLPPLEPKHEVIKNAKWVSSNVPGHSGKILLPPEFDGDIVTETATSEFLRYYGCSFADSSSEKVALLQRHGIVDFTYENDYVDEFSAKNGGIEVHDFSHLDCPLSRDSGTFILGKFVENGDLHLTGFIIPPRKVLYVPKGCIHSNDHLKGTWRTMLSDDAPIDHVHLLKHVSESEEFPIFFKFL